jgi:hypothetical protein
VAQIKLIYDRVYRRITLKEIFLQGRATMQGIIGSNKNGIFTVKSNYLFV